MMGEHKQHREQGFSLIEIMLALVLSSIVLTVGFTLLTLGTQLNARTEALLAANAAAFAKVQQYENKVFTDIPIGTAGNQYVVEDFSTSLPTITSNIVKSGTAKVYTQYANDTTQSLIKIRVVIDFKYGSRDRKIEYGSYIQLGGVGR